MQEPITDLTVISELISLPCLIYHTEGISESKTRNPNLQFQSPGRGLQKKNKSKKKVSKTRHKERKITKNLIIKLLIWKHFKTYLCYHKI